MKLGIISDTHDFLHPRVPELFAGVAHILHGGDVGMPDLLSQLEDLAPVTAVAGNTDVGNPIRLRPIEVIKVGGRKFLLHHILDPRAPDPALAARIARERPDVVVFGHTHKKFCETINGVLYLNPGYSGRPKFALERSVAILHCDAKELRVEFLPL